MNNEDRILLLLLLLMCINIIIGSSIKCESEWPILMIQMTNVLMKIWRWLLLND